MLPVWTPLVLLSKFFVEIELYPLKCRAMVLKKGWRDAVSNDLKTMNVFEA